MAATVPDVPTLLASVSAFLDTMNAYITQITALDNGSATAVIAPITQTNGQVSSQPDTGWYPITDRSGNVSWHPCPAKIVLLAGTLKVKVVQLGFTTGFTGSSTAYTFQATDSGWYYWMRAGANTSTAITLTLPKGLPQGWSCIIAQQGTGKISFAVSTGDTLIQRNSFTGTAGTGAEASIKCVYTTGGNATFILSGDLS